MGLSFAALTDAALGGGTGWMQGKEQGRQTHLKESQTAAALQRQTTLDQIAMELHKSQIAENEAQRQEALGRAAKLQYDLDHPKPVAPVLGTPEYRQAHKDLETDKASVGAPKLGSPEFLKAETDLANARARATAANRPKQEWEVYGPSGDRAGNGGAVSAGDARTASARKEFVSNWVAAANGNPHDAAALVGKTPAEQAKAEKFGVTRADWLAAESEYKLKHKIGSGSELDALAGDSEGAPVATAPSSAPQPKRSISSNATAQGLEASLPVMPPAVVRADNRNGTGTAAGQKAPGAPLPTSTPRSNPMRANSPKAGTSEAPKGADPEKYHNDPKYRRWVDSLSSSK